MKSKHFYVLFVVFLVVYAILRLIFFPPVFGIEDLDLAEKISPYLLVVTATLFGFVGTMAVYRLSYLDGAIESMSKDAAQIIFKKIEYSETEELKIKNRKLLDAMDNSSKGLEKAIEKLKTKKSDFKDSLFGVAIAFISTILLELSCLGSLITYKTLTPYSYYIARISFLASFFGVFLILYEVAVT